MIRYTFHIHLYKITHIFNNTMTKENDITSIRVPKSVKEELGKVALAKESYHVTIQRLIQENQQLKKANERSDELISLYKEMNIGSYDSSSFAKKVCEEYLSNPKHCPTLESYKQINTIIFSAIPSEEKIKGLELSYNNDWNEGDNFICALDYYVLNTTKNNIELFNAFLSKMQENNPYDELDKTTHFKWIKWNNRFSKRYEY